MTLHDWLRLFPDSNHRLQLNLRPGNAQTFWAPSPEAETVLAERRRWLAQTPERYCHFLPTAAAAVQEALSTLPGSALTPLEAAQSLEPDWLLLSGEPGGPYPVLGGAVVFPSGWALQDKLGHPLSHAHAPVPGLQQSLGPKIATFLDRIAPTAQWERENWGLTATPSLNQHPALHVAKLTPAATLATTWLRLERQFLTRLPHTQAILFGIRVTHHQLDHLASLPGLAPRLARALETQEGDLARYKGIEPARAALLSELR